MNTIVVGVDPEHRSVAATAWAQLVASSVGAEVRVVELLQSTSAEIAPDDADRLAEREAARLDGWLTDHDLQPADMHVEVATPPEELGPQAEQFDASMVVIGGGTTEGVGPWALGSIARHLAQTLDRPLVVVPDDPVDGNGAGPLIVGVDGSDGSQAALRWAEQLAGALHRTVRSVCAEPPDALVDEAIAVGALLVVVAARDHASLGGLLLGEVPDRLLHHPRVPVAIMPHAMLAPPEPEPEAPS